MPGRICLGIRVMMFVRGFERMGIEGTELVILLEFGWT